MIALTFDSDYMTENLFETFFKEITFPGDGTFFLHKHFKEDLFGNHEIGIHPYLEERPDTWTETTERLMKQFKRPIKGIRAHSCVNSQPFHGKLPSMGVKYVSHTTPFKVVNACPYLMPWGVWELPVQYMDNMDYCWDINCPPEKNLCFDKKFLQSIVELDNEAHVFDFHPIHLLLNTPNYEYWTQVRSSIGLKPANELRYKGRGVATYFNELVSLMNDKGIKSLSGLKLVSEMNKRA